MCSETIKRREAASSYIFFFQAEDGIRDVAVTGVQTCALPILRWGSLSLRKSPCIWEHCRLCQSGEGHSSYALYGRKGKRRVLIFLRGRLPSRLALVVLNWRGPLMVVVVAGHTDCLAP